MKMVLVEGSLCVWLVPHHEKEAVDKKSWLAYISAV